jgi:hypothetical protein
MDPSQKAGLIRGNKNKVLKASCKNQFDIYLDKGWKIVFTKSQRRKCFNCGAVSRVSLGDQPVQRVTDDVNRYSVAIKCNLYMLVHSPQTSYIRKLTASGSSSINSQLAQTILYFCKTDGSNGSYGKVGGVL